MAIAAPLPSRDARCVPPIGAADDKKAIRERQR
jgi:hypothetical protein